MATAMMTAMAATNDGWVFSGILEYRKRDPKTEPTGSSRQARCAQASAPPTLLSTRMSTA
jgi:hypothetical protein